MATDEKYAAQFEYSDAELLALFREAYAGIAATGKSYTIRGRTYMAADLEDVWNQIVRLEGRTGTGDVGIASNVVRLKRAR